MNLIDYITRQKEWSLKTFLKGHRTKGICKHIKSELEEIEKSPHDIMEWVDVMILAFDGAWRAGYAPEEIATALEAKQKINFNRHFPVPKSDDEPSYHTKAD